MHVALVAAAVEEAEHSLPFAPWVFGVGAFVGLLALLLVTYAFRGVGSRH